MFSNGITLRDALDDAQQQYMRIVSTMSKLDEEYINLCISRQMSSDKAHKEHILMLQKTTEGKLSALLWVMGSSEDDINKRLEILKLSARDRMEARNV